MQQIPLLTLAALLCLPFTNVFFLIRLAVLYVTCPECSVYNNVVRIQYKAIHQTYFYCPVINIFSLSSCISPSRSLYLSWIV